MKLYYSPGACSLSPHIVLHEAGIEHEVEKVDTKAKKTASGADFWAVNAKGSVPVIELDDGQFLTEGPAIVQYIADQVPGKKLVPAAGTMERYRMQEMLNFITSELHKGYSPLFNPGISDDMKAIVRETLYKKYAYIDGVLAKDGPYLFGKDFSVADAYLFTVSTWAKHTGVDIEKFPAVSKFMATMKARPSVQSAMEMEGTKAA